MKDNEPKEFTFEGKKYKIEGSKAIEVKEKRTTKRKTRGKTKRYSINYPLVYKVYKKKKKKLKVWELFYPDGTSSLMTYNPIQKYKDREKKIKDLHNVVVTGLVNGLSHTSRDKRLNDIDFWRQRCNLFNTFSLCVLSILTDQNPEYSEKELKEIAEEGYK